MDGLTPTTELEAVNTILSIMGESPVNSLSVEGDLYVERAQSALKEMSREVQSKGWYFNRDYEYSLAKDVDGKISIPLNALEVTPDGDNYEDPFVSRGDFLYDIEDQTYVFTAAVSCTIVWFLDWTNLPQAARRYITIRAARAAQERLVGSENVHKFTMDDEKMALNELMRNELRAVRANVFTKGSTTITKMIRNRSL